ncbi:MAG TPA: beta-propeller fold lactonase family protein [Terracidiphilus sp.]|nr:beta-propeller fold lactonase family protein [Terracidiphilus sp.]
MRRSSSGRALAAALVALFVSVLADVMWGVHPVRAVVAMRTGEHLRYASPVELLFSRDGARLFVLCQESDEVRVLDASTYAQIAAIPVGHIPRGFALSADGGTLYVASSWDDSISVIDTRTLRVESTWHEAAEPTSVAVDLEGKRLYVANRISNDVAVLDAKTGVEEKRLTAGIGTSYLAVSPDGKLIFATHVFPNPTPFRTPPESEITVIDTRDARVVQRIPLHAIAGVFHVAVSADGRLGVAAELHPKNLVPLASLEHGGAFEDTLTLFGADVGAEPVEVPLDELELYASRPFGVAITRDGRWMYVTSGGSQMVTVVDVRRLLRYVRLHRNPFAEDLSASANYVVRRIGVGQDPRGVVLSPDGDSALVANRLDDTISVIDTRTNQLRKTIQLASPKCINVLRYGEQTFYTSRYSFEGQIGCANCHIDSSFDALSWDLEPDGFGINIVNNRLLEDLRGTEPYKWNGGNPNLPTECGPRTEKYFWRSENYDDRTLADLVTYVRSIPARPNRWKLPGYELTPAQRRGKAIFERAVDKFGNPIPLRNRCSYCHSGQKGTNQKSFDVGTGKSTDLSGVFDTPQLTNIALTAPYLHDGSAATLEEIWTIYNPHDKHGRTNDLTKDELNDLIEYLKTR